jgi:hypothetical protein
MSRPTPLTYKTRNWPSYNEALKRRGSLTIWFDPTMIWGAAPTGKRGRQPAYSDAAIQTCLTMKVLFGMALRQTTGFVESLLRLIGLDRAVPDFSTLSRRQKTLKVNIPYRGSDGPLHLLVDSTGIKVEGEGEWNARKHGGTKRRVWRKIHIGIDEKSLEIRAAEFTTNDIGDAPMLPELLDQIPRDQEIATVTADGAFDTRKCHDAIAARGAAAIIPPRMNAKPWKPDTAGAPRHCPRTNGGQCLDPQRDPADIEARRSNHLATMERLSPPKPCRNQNALCETAGPTPERTGLRPSGRRVPRPRRRPQRLHRARHTHHRARRISPFRERETPTFSRFVQQSPVRPSALYCHYRSLWTLLPT